MKSALSWAIDYRRAGLPLYSGGGRDRVTRLKGAARSRLFRIIHATFAAGRVALVLSHAHQYSECEYYSWHINGTERQHEEIA